MTLAGIVLAAGRSARMGSPKALLDFRGLPFAVRILEALEALEVKTRVIVLGPDAPRIQPAIAGHDCIIVENPEPETGPIASLRSEEHTSELQSRSDLVCRLLLEKKKKCCRAVFCNLLSNSSPAG